MSAYDLAIATRNALAVPEIAKWAATHEYSFVDPHGRARTTSSTTTRCCRAAAPTTSARSGSRPATPSRAQHTLVAVATRNGRTLIAVILGVPDAGLRRRPRRCSTPASPPRPTRPAPARRCPPVAVSRCADRAADQAAFAKLGTTDAARSAHDRRDGARRRFRCSTAPLAATAEHAHRATTTSASTQAPLARTRCDRATS